MDFETPPRTFSMEKHVRPLASQSCELIWSRFQGPFISLKQSGGPLRQSGGSPIRGYIRFLTP
jgi:hypothetical protein